jgi:hypothetical protein
MRIISRVYKTNLQPFFGWRFFVFRNHLLNFEKNLIIDSRIGQYGVQNIPKNKLLFLGIFFLSQNNFLKLFRKLSDYLENSSIV